MYFVGDTEDPTSMLTMRNLDVLFITPWLTCRAPAASEPPDARRVVLYHQFPDKRLKVCGEPEILSQGQTFFLSPVQGQDAG